MENAQERLDSLNESIKRLTEAVRVAFEPIDSSVLVLQAKELSEAFESLTESVSRSFSDLPASTFADALRHIDEMYRRDILPAISGIQFPENFELSPISDECMEKLSDISDSLPQDSKEKPKLIEALKSKKIDLQTKLTIISILWVILWDLFTFTWNQAHPQQGDTTNININSVNIVEINSQNQDVISEDNRELAEKILEVISEFTEDIDNIDGDIVSNSTVKPDRADSIENDMDE